MPGSGGGSHAVSKSDQVPQAQHAGGALACCLYLEGVALRPRQHTDLLNNAALFELSLPSSLRLQLPNFHKLSMISLLAAIMSIAYSTIAIGLAGREGKQSDVQYNLNGFTKPNGVFGILNSLGTIAFAYGGGCCTHVVGPDRQCRALQLPTLQSAHGVSPASIRSASIRLLVWTPTHHT